MGREPFNAKPDTGRLGYRNQETDPYPDDRPVLSYRHPFWQDMEEELRYERAAKLCPVSASGSLTLDQYLSEIVKLAEGLAPGRVKSMPKAGLP